MEKLDETNVNVLLGAPTDHRRKWDLEEFERLAAKRLCDENEQVSNAKKRIKGDEDSSGLSPTESTVPEKRALLRPREHKIDLMESEIGRSRLVSRTSISSKNASLLGFYCNVCDCVVKDSTNFLDHINGKKHQRNMGMSMKIERSTLDKIQQRFATNKKKMQEKKQEYDLMTAVKDQELEEMYWKEKRKEQRRERKEQAAMALQKESEEGIGNSQDESVMMATMGFCKFGGTGM